MSSEAPAAADLEGVEAPARPVRKPTPWTWLGCGCGMAVVILMFGFAGATWLFYREGKKLQESFPDPVKREALSREVVAFDALPPGYHSLGALSVPFLMDTAIFSDEEPGPKPEEAGFRDRGFFYFSMRDFGRNRAELAAYLEGKGPKPEFMKRGGADVEEGEILRRGTVDLAGRKVVYAASRGRFNVQGKDRQGITTLLHFDCPDEKRLRFGLWFGPDPAPGKPADPATLAGTPADPEAIRAFLGHFEVCPAA